MKYCSLIALIVCCTLTLSRGADEPKKQEKKPKPVNTTCPVTDEAVDPDVATTQYKGKTVGFCCADCVKDFNKDPAKYMKKVEAEEAKKKDAAKKGEQPAAEKSVAVNKFCPIETDHAVDATVAMSTYKGKKVGFCCEDCIKKFEQDPDAYAAKMK
jgi:YHS domain-containing protein